LPFAPARKPICRSNKTGTSTTFAKFHDAPEIKQTWPTAKGRNCVGTL
jgi:hypothetical protein